MLELGPSRVKAKSMKRNRSAAFTIDSILSTDEVQPKSIKREVDLNPRELLLQIPPFRDLHHRSSYQTVPQQYYHHPAAAALSLCPDMVFPGNPLASLLHHSPDLDEFHHINKNPFYAPCPFIPGSDFGSYLMNSYRKPKRVRTAFSPHQLLQLEKAFEVNQYVVGQERKELATTLQLTETQVKVWFQNRRTKHKRVKSESPRLVSEDSDEEQEPTKNLSNSSDSTT